MADHGISRYTNNRCRCDICVEAWRRYQRAQRLRLAELEPPEHGTLTAYNGYSCRCESCRAANSEYHRAYRARKEAIR